MMSLKASIGTGAGGVEIIEIQALFTQLIQVRREVAPIAIAAHVLGAETFDGHQHDVGFARGAGVADLAPDIQRVLADEAGVGFAEFGAQCRATTSVGRFW